MIQTRGHVVTNLPQVNFVDPSLLFNAQTNPMAGVNEGLNAYGKLAQIQEEAQLAPLRQQLAQISVENAPLEKQRLLAQIGQEQMAAAIPHDVVEETTYEGGRLKVPEEGETPSFNIFDDLVRVEKGYTIGPGGIKTPFTRKKIEKPAYQLEDEYNKQQAGIERTNALTEASGITAQANLTRAEAAQISANARLVAAGKLKEKWFPVKAADGQIHMKAFYIDNSTTPPKIIDGETLMDTVAPTGAVNISLGGAFNDPNSPYFVPGLSGASAQPAPTTNYSYKIIGP